MLYFFLLLLFNNVGCVFNYEKMCYVCFTFPDKVNDYSNKQLNYQQLRRRGIAGVAGQREQTGEKRGEKMGEENKKKQGDTPEARSQVDSRQLSQATLKVKYTGGKKSQKH